MVSVSGQEDFTSSLKKQKKNSPVPLHRKPKFKCVWSTSGSTVILTLNMTLLCIKGRLFVGIDHIHKCAISTQEVSNLMEFV
jgi:hypothetical protein